MLLALGQEAIPVQASEAERDELLEADHENPGSSRVDFRSAEQIWFPEDVAIMEFAVVVVSWLPFMMKIPGLHFFGHCHCCSYCRCSTIYLGCCCYLFWLWLALLFLSSEIAT